MASSTFGSICKKRSITLRAPNSGAADDQTAPIEAQASNAATVSGMFGMYAATRSPSETPNARSPAAMARADGSLPANTCSAYDTRAPGNHEAPGIASLASTRSPPSANRTPQNSTSEPQNASTSRTDQRHRSWYPSNSNPRVSASQREYRVTVARSILSGLGGPSTLGSGTAPPRIIP